MILTYLKEHLVSEALPIKLAKRYTKKARENTEQLDPEVKELYNKIFGHKNRIVVDKVSMGKDKTSTKLSDIFNRFVSLIKQFDVSKNFDVSYDHKNGDKITVKFNDPEVEKDFKQARVSGDLYLLKTFAKRLKKHIDKQAHPVLQDIVSKFITLRTDTETDVSSMVAPLVLSRHGYDVAGMATNRRWKPSCKNAVDGCNRRFLDNEVGQILISYLADPSDADSKGKDMLSNPLGRTLVLPVRDEHTDELGLFVLDEIYGAGEDTDFLPKLKKFLSNFTKVYDNDHPNTLNAVGNYYVGDTRRKVRGKQGELSDTDIESIIVKLLPQFFDFIPEDQEDDLRNALTLKINDEYEDNPNIHKDDFISSFEDWADGVFDLMDLYAANFEDAIPWKGIIHYPIDGFGNEDLIKEWDAFMAFLKKNNVSLKDYR